MANLTLSSNVRVDGIPTKTASPVLLVRLSRIGAIVLISLLSAGICAAQEQEQSPSERPLSTVAREKSTRKAKVVITDDDMPSHAKPAPEPSVTASPEIAAAKKDEAAKQQPKQTTAPTSLSQPVRLDQAQQLVEQLKQQEKMLIHSYDELERKLAEADSESRRRIFSESLANRDLSLARKRKQIEEAERALQRIDKAGPPQGETTDAAK
jgi:hypothetical protein